MRTYRRAIFTIWTLSFLYAAVYLDSLKSSQVFLDSHKLALYVWTSYSLILTLIICGSYLSICRKFQHGSVASQQQNRASQNKRLTKTLLFVSILALMSWLPLISLNGLDALDVSIPWRYFFLATILNYSNSFVNPHVRIKNSRV